MEESGSKEERKQLKRERKTKAKEEEEEAEAEALARKMETEKEERKRLKRKRKAAQREEEAEAEAEALARMETEKEEGRKGKRQEVEASSSSSSSRSAVGAGAGAEVGAGAGAGSDARAAVGAVLVEGDLSRKGSRSLFKGWLKSKQMRLKKLTEQEKGEQFRKFVKRFNKHKLPDSYYLPGAEEAEDGDAGDTKVAKTGETREKGGVEGKGETEESEEGGGHDKPSRARVKDSSGQKKTPTPRAEGDSSGNMFGKTYWTEEMDARLLEAVENFGRNWVRVAAHMDGGVNRHQCSKRYTTNADPALQELNNGPWTDKEFELLKSLVEKHSTGRGGRIDWVRVGRELGRSKVVCSTKWNNFQRNLRTQSLKKGHFSPEEDATILAGVAAWDTNETGLWTGLERELGRGSTNIQYRWNTISSQRLHSIGEGESGSKERRGRKSKAREEEEETVKEGSKGKKQKVEASSSSSSSRSADAGAEAGKTVEKVKGEKGEVEVKGEIEEGEEGGGCGEGDAEPSRARARGCSGQVKACSSTAEGPLKKGSFSPKEDAIILARVAAWDMNEQGLWIVLGRELGRAASNILAQWTQIISMIRESAIEKIGSKEERRRLDWERKTAKATKAREEEVKAEAEALARMETEKEGGKGKRQEVEASSSSSRSDVGVGTGAEVGAGAGAGADARAAVGAVLVEGDLSRKGSRSLFKGWLKSKQMRLKKLTEQEKGEQFRKFVKRFNMHKLPDSYYRSGEEEVGAGEAYWEAGETKVTGEIGEKEKGEGKGEKGERKTTKAREEKADVEALARKMQTEKEERRKGKKQKLEASSSSSRSAVGAEAGKIGEKEKGEKGEVEVKVETEEGEEGGGGGEGDAKLSRARAKGSSGQKKARTPRAKRDSSGGLFGFMQWTREMDARLLEAVEKFGRNWVRVAAHMDGGVNNHQCLNRYITNADPALQELNRGPWTDEEFELLKLLVEKHSTGREGRIDWVRVGRELGRSTTVCGHKWNSSQRVLRAKSWKKGPFSPEEDAIIQARVAAWDMNETGLWSGLERELGRLSSNICKRWERHLSKSR